MLILKLLIPRNHVNLVTVLPATEEHAIFRKGSMSMISVPTVKTLLSIIPIWIKPKREFPHILWVRPNNLRFGTKRSKRARRHLGLIVTIRISVLLRWADSMEFHSAMMLRATKSLLNIPPVQEITTLCQLTLIPLLKRPITMPWIMEVSRSEIMISQRKSGSWLRVCSLLMVIKATFPLRALFLVKVSKALILRSTKMVVPYILLTLLEMSIY